MNLQDYIRPELLILIPVLYLIGMGLKKSSLPDKWIPLTLGAIGVALSALWVCATCPMTTAGEIMTAIFTAVTQGVLAAGASVYVNQTARQATKEE